MSESKEKQRHSEQIKRFIREKRTQRRLTNEMRKENCQLLLIWMGTKFRKQKASK